MHKFLIFINALCAFGLGLSYLSAILNPETMGALALFGLFYPYLLLLNLFFLLFWLISDWKYASISFFAILIGVSHVSSFYGIHSPKEKNSKGQMISIGSMNINAGYYFRIPDKKLSEERIAFLSDQFINDKVDVFCFQEANHAVNDYISALLPSYQKAVIKKTTTSIFSRYPIKDFGNLIINERRFKSCLWADIEFNNEVIRVYSVHLYSNKLTKETEAIIADRSFGDRKFIDDVQYILGSYINSAKKRTKEVDIILKHISKSPYPVIIAGDFNDTPQSFIYNKIKKAGYCDAFQQAAKGVGSTYTGYLPFLRIDYTFAEDHAFDIIDHKIIKKRMSDHFPQISTFNLVN